MNLPHPEQMKIIGMTKARLAKMRLHVVPEPPCNDNRDLCSAHKKDASERLANAVGCLWRLRWASLLAAASRCDIQHRNPKPKIKETINVS